MNSKITVSKTLNTGEMVVVEVETGANASIAAKEARAAIKVLEEKDK